MHAFLEAGRDLQVASINADGTPHLVTMWYVLDGDDLVLLDVREEPEGREPPA